MAKTYFADVDQDGVPGVLDIQGYQGKLRSGQKQDWRRHIFQIKDGFLRYYTNFKVSIISMVIIL